MQRNKKARSKQEKKKQTIEIVQMNFKKKKTYVKERKETTSKELKVQEQCLTKWDYCQKLFFLKEPSEILELQSMITVMKNSLLGLCRFQPVEEKNQWTWR